MVSPKISHFALNCVAKKSENFEGEDGKILRKNTGEKFLIITYYN